MRSSSIFTAAACVPAALGAAIPGKPKNFIWIIPDGLGGAGTTLDRTYESIVNGEAEMDNPVIEPLTIDDLAVGVVKTHTADRLVTDSAAAGTAFATGQKTDNAILSLTPDGLPLGTVLEAAKVKGMKTGLVATSVIYHATPAAFASHSLSRRNMSLIAEQMIGYSHPLNQSVDLLLGGGQCEFKPSSDPESCREDDIDLLSFADESGYYIAEDRAAFDALELGKGDIDLPYLGIFSYDDSMAYDIDRQQQPEEERQPSLYEMAETALNALTGSDCDNEPGYFLMIEASRPDHARPDSVAYLHDVRQYHAVVELVKNWIDAHPDTAMIASSDHETGGLSLPVGWDPRPLANATHSVEYLIEEYAAYFESNNTAAIAAEVFPIYGLPANETLAASLLGSEDLEYDMGQLLNEFTGMSWGTDSHTMVDPILYAYGAGKLHDKLVLDFSGTKDNTELAPMIAKYLDLDIDAVTEMLREDISWVR